MNNYDAYLVQNPAIGAYLIYHFVKGYYANKQKNVPIHLLFIVLPFMFDEACRQAAISFNKNKGISKLVDKINNGNKTNSIYLINKKAIKLKECTWDSINIAMASSLIDFDFETAEAFVLNDTVKEPRFNETLSKMIKASEKIGFVFADSNLIELCSYLNVRF